MDLLSPKKKQYRAIGHKLKPVVTVAGKGLSESVLTEINRALEDHELIKIRFAITDRESRKAILAAIQSKCRADLIQEIGKIGLFYRKSKKVKAALSNIPERISSP